MATKAAHRRLTREYKSISQNPPPYIVAHPSESNILEWHYIITGPEDTPYHGGQYWGTLMFPPDYPFAPPAIRMHTPSGRFQPSQRLCLSISDFHPRSFNPAWEVSTILIGLLSFMTSEEMTMGSVSGTKADRKQYAKHSRWWNSMVGSSTSNSKGMGDGGAKFRSEWPEVHEKNMKWLKEHRIDPQTGRALPAPASSSSSSSAAPSSSMLTSCGMATTGAATGAAAGASGTQAQTVVDAVRQGRGAGSSWLWRNQLYVFGGAVFMYVLVVRIMGGMQ
ncbi:ubiquitin-conjugating enzyme [Ophiostoma piceae UAMH 11346]|uniref:Ubiquitin-conjugating enzyme n=1 Tax=Ophiostoma piceae (strain UAMH 11346) TaxID=1262450 RepID=S3CPU0_OPHP1|nr:ubiquitin-conjugating enzyme [Ophiostoma piceae UAMH 11346]